MAYNKLGSQPIALTVTRLHPAEEPDHPAEHRNLPKCNCRTAQSVWRLARGWRVQGSKTCGGEPLLSRPDGPRDLPSLLCSGCTGPLLRAAADLPSLLCSGCAGPLLRAAADLLWLCCGYDLVPVSRRPLPLAQYKGRVHMSLCIVRHHKVVCLD